MKQMTVAQAKQTKGGIIFALALVAVNAAAWGRVAYLLR